MRIRIDTPAGGPALRAGMSVEASIDTGRARGLPQFVANLFTTARAGTVRKD
jgi:membrane fusion protein (multidrug efflux system)